MADQPTHQPDQSPPGHPPAFNSRAHFRRRLGLYLFGVAIGFLILGAIQMMKKTQAARKAPAQTQNQPTPTITTRIAPEPADTP